MMFGRYGCFLFCLALTHIISAQNCDPDSLSKDRASFAAGNFAGEEQIKKLHSLMQELKTLATTPYQGAQRKAMKHCLDRKNELFVRLMLRKDAKVMESAEFQETVSDFYRLHNDPRTALRHIDRALEINSQSLDLQWKALELFAEVKSLQLTDLSGKPIAIPEAKRVLAELHRRADKIVSHPSASKDMLIQALSYQALGAYILRDHALEMQLWERVLGLDPKNKSALQRRFLYYLSKDLVPQTLEAMRRLQREGLATKLNWVLFMDFLFKNERWDEITSFERRLPEELKKSHPEMRLFVLRALIETGRASDSEKLLASLPKEMSPRARRLEREIRSRLNERRGDTLKTEGRLSEALELYKSALPHSPRPLTLKEKISLLIYDYRKGLDFRPPEATQKDLEEVVRLLENSVFSTEVKESLLGIFLHSLRFTKNTKLLAKACLRYKELYPGSLKSNGYRDHCTR